MEEQEKFETENLNFTHEELMEITGTALNELLAQDNFLNDLPKGVVLEEVNNQIALKYGRSITIYVLREDGEKMPVVVCWICHNQGILNLKINVPQAEGTVSELKKSIRRFISLKLHRLKRKKTRLKCISWKYIWKTYDLQHDDVPLIDNNAKLSDLGIKNKSYVYFVKKRRKKWCNN